VAKVTGPLMSLTASGKLGNAIVFMTWRGIQDVRKWLKPANPKSEKQTTVRENFALAVTKYHTLDGADMEALRVSCQSRPYTGFNQWVGWVRRALTLVKTWVTIKTVGVTPIAGGLTATAKGTPDAAGKLKCFVGRTAGSWTMSFNEEEPGGDANVEHTVNLTGLTPATVYWATMEFPEVSEKYGYTGWFTFTTLAAA